MAVATTSTGHIDRRTEPRMGWFKKTEDGMPHKDYKAECISSKKGYIGPRHEAHHVLPATSIRKSAAESGKNPRYIQDVQWITDWNINAKDNLIGLPTFHSYAQYYQRQIRLAGGDMPSRGKRLVAYFNSQFSKKKRTDWLSEFGAHNPEHHPIHNPVCWGHTKYNTKVQTELKTQVWDPLNDKKKTHEVDAGKARSALDTLAKKWSGHLVKRGIGANQKKWDRLIDDKDDDDAYEPFTMYDVSEHPLYG